MTAFTESPPASRGEIVRLVAVVLPSRFVLNTAYRMGYAFLPAFGRGLGVDLQAMSALVTLRSSTGLTAPLFGPLADRFGRRAALLAALALFVVCAVLAFTASSLWWFAAGFVGLSVAKVIFDPSSSAYLADRVPYERRGLVLGINELGWAGAGFIGVPLMAQAIDRIGWQSPYVIIAVAGVAALAWAFAILPRSSRRVAGVHIDARAAFAAIRANRSALIMLSVTGLYMAGAEMIGVTYAAWLERTFNADVLMIGSIAATFGIADVVGEVLSMWVVDRFGKKRSLLVGLVCVALAYFGMPLLGASLPLAVAGLFIYYVCFEFTIVSVWPLVSELVPEARATLMSVTATANYVGRMAGAPLGAFLFAQAGFGANGIAAGLCVAVATAVFAIGVHERKRA
ncbi:MAG: MFS transporter [Chloroflexi bacterium]|nr:MFS transporter [Chloroflexota bacterium]